MFDLSFAGSVRAALRGAKTLLLIAPAARLQKAKFPKKLLDKRLTDLVLELAKETPAGARGSVGSTLCRPPSARDKGGPSWLRIGVLPNEVSRYNAPSRADAIRNVVAAADLARAGKVAVVLVLDDPSHLLAAANAVARALPRFSAKAEPPNVKVQLVAVGPDGEPLATDDVVEATVECSRDAAELVDTPPTDLNPDTFAQRIHAMLKGKSVRVEEIKGDKLVERGLLGIHSVGRAASAPPRLIIAQYKGSGDGPHVALVGKGITFDTGGLSLKLSGAMATMKCDMGGAAAVLGAFRVLVREGCPLRLSLLLCIAENAIDARSYKLDDVLRMHSGKTVEINNTDAEGRLLLADGVSWAARELQADVIIDAATLTGAQLVSTGLLHAAVVSDDADLEARAIEAGKHTGDLAHPLIFAPELFQGEFKSVVADMRNSVANRSNAQSSCAAQFVYSHLQGAPGAKQRRWCHIDLAGPAFPKDRGTGYGVALISEIVRRLTP